MTRHQALALSGSCLCLLLSLLPSSLPAQEPASMVDGLLTGPDALSLGRSWFLALDDGEASRLYGRGLTLLLEGRPAEAAVLLGRVVCRSRHEPEAAEAALADAHLKAGAPDRACLWYDHWLATYGPDPQVLRNLGVARGATGDTTGAAAALEASLALNDADPETHFQYALVCDRLDRPRDTVAHAQKAVQLDATFKTRLQPLIKNSRVARRIGNIITDVLKQTEGSALTDEQIDEYARRVGQILGEENLAPRSLTVKERLRNFR